MSLFIGILTFVLIIVSLLLVLVVLMQKAKSDGGVAAMGGGAAESAFGAETGNVLVGATRNLAIIFFVLSFVLYLANIYQSKKSAGADAALPAITAPATVAPAAPAAQPEAAKPGEPKS